MWSFASNAISGAKKTGTNPSTSNADCSDDEVSSCVSADEGLECPICWESFNIVENVPYVLWCGHTLCKNCVLGLQWAVVKFPTLPIQLPFFISCPWCQLLSFRLVYKGILKFPRKNFFILWMVESMNSDRPKSRPRHGDNNHMVWPSSTNVLSSSSGIAAAGSSISSNGYHHHGMRRVSYAHQEQPDPNPNHHHDDRSGGSYLNVDRISASFRKSLAFFVHLTAKFPLVLIFLIIVLYAIPASAVVLALYILITILFALPSFLILYFAYPCLDWLIREIIT